jgi:hypothetical protein
MGDLEIDVQAVYERLDLLVEMSERLPIIETGEHVFMCENQPSTSNHFI